jgi:hypothetical protein
VWGAWVAWTALSVQAEASSARDELRDVRSELDALAIVDGDGVDRLEEQERTFEEIRDRLDHPLLAPVRVLPVAGRQLDAASHQAAAAAASLRAVSELGDEVRSIVDRGVGAGPERVETLLDIAATARRGKDALVGLDLGPDDALVGPLASSRLELDEALGEILDGLDRAELMGQGLAEFFEGPNDYLLLAANNAQMQNGQGMFLSGGVLRVEAGRLDLGPMEPLDRVPDVEPPVPLDADLAARWGWLDPNRDVRHLGLSARYPVTADTAARLWSALGRPPVEGVVAVDPVMLATIMEATGPVRTSRGEHGSDDVLEYILHGQYEGYPAAGGDTGYTAERRDELDEIARAVVDAFDGVEDLEPEFLDDVRTSAVGRHLLMWSSDPRVQAGFEAAGVHGQIGSDSVLLSLVNRSGVKLDWFVRVSADLSVERTADGYAAVLDVAVTNRAPADGEPGYVVGPYPGSGLDRGDYLGLVTLNLPAGATNSRFDGVDRLAVSGGDGDNRTIAAWVTVPRGTTSHLVARFELPASMAELLIEPSGRARPTTWTYDGREWKDRERRTLPL